MRLILSTITEDEAPLVAKVLVEERLVACVNIVPKIRSIYRWEGKIEDERESLMLMKTTGDRARETTKRLKELHPYEVPEIITVHVNPDEGNADYLQWVRNAVETS